MGKSKKLRKNSRGKQKLYKMRGCAKKTRKNYLGGSPDAPLAYTGHPTPSQPNPFLAYIGKGGASCGLSNTSAVQTNTNAANPSVPNTGPPILPTGTPIWNQASTQRGGNCGGTCSTQMVLKGGCGTCSTSQMVGGYTDIGFMVAGSRHRNKCKCSNCKNKIMKGGNSGIPYPNGQVGSAFTPGKIGGWPGVDGIPGNHNYFTNNTYNNDVSRQMIDVGANPPFLKGGRKKQKGGTFSNFMGQDLLNLGRQFQFGLGSAYNALAGYSSPVNPLPWKDQFPNKGLSFNPSTI